MNTSIRKRMMVRFTSRTNAIDDLYADMRSKTTIHPNGALQTHSWGMREFSLLDPDHNLLTFGQPV